MTASSHPAKPDLTVAETCVQAGPKSDLRFDVIGLHTERNRQYIRRGVVDQNGTEAPVFGGFITAG